MITWIIVLLAVLLVLLLIDWQGVLKRFPALQKMLSNRAVPKQIPTGGASEALKAAGKKIPSFMRPKLPDRTKKPVAKRVDRTWGLTMGSSKPSFDPDVQVIHDDVMDDMLPPMRGNGAAPAPTPEPQPQYAPEVQELLNEADIFFRKGELKAAEQKYLQAAAKDPRCSKAYSRLGVIYLENGEDWQDAEEAFRQALKTDADNGYILNNLGLVLYHQDRYADAIRQFEMAVRQDELNANRHANLGKAYMAMRQYAKAESSFKKALKLLPNEMEYKDLLGEAMEKKLAHKAMIRR
jgi:tetratricopeptide (TPR) repeat protein